MEIPRLKNGQIVSRKCPVCIIGDLQPEVVRRTGRTDWYCDGLIDPEYSHQPLILCMYGIYDGEIVGNN